MRVFVEDAVWVDVISADLVSSPLCVVERVLIALRVSTFDATPVLVAIDVGDAMRVTTGDLVPLLLTVGLLDCALVMLRIWRDGREEIVQSAMCGHRREGARESIRTTNKLERSPHAAHHQWPPRLPPSRHSLPKEFLPAVRRAV